MKYAIIKFILKILDFFPSKKAPSYASYANGGSAIAIGNNCSATGGNAGTSSTIGVGGKGGNASVVGENIYALGGDGGNAGTADGRGGRRAQSPGEKLNLPTNMWGYGYGGMATP